MKTSFIEWFKLFYYIGKEDEITIIERPFNIIGSFFFAIFFYTLFFMAIPNSKQERR